MANGQQQYNWRQLVPALLAASAGYANPQQAPSIAAQAIQGQRLQMQQKRDEEAQKQFKQRMSLEKQQLGLQKQRTDILQAQEDRARDAQAADRWLALQADNFAGKDIDQIDENELLKQLSEKAKDQGVKITQRQLWDFTERWLPTHTGDKHYYFDPVSGHIKVREKLTKGKKTYWTDGEDITEVPAEVLMAAKGNPGMIRAIADQLRSTPHVNKKTIEFFDNWAKHEMAGTVSSTAEKNRLAKIEKIFGMEKKRLNVKYFGSEADPKAGDLPVDPSLTMEDYQYDYQQIAKKRDAAIMRGTYKSPKVPASVKSYQKEVMGRDVTDRMWGRMTKEQKMAAVQIAEAHQRASGKTMKKPTRKEAAVQNMKNTFGVPAPNLLKPTGNMYGPPMDLETVKRMMNQGAGL